MKQGRYLKWGVVGLLALLLLAAIDLWHTLSTQGMTGSGVIAHARVWAVVMFVHLANTMRLLAGERRRREAWRRAFAAMGWDYMEAGSNPERRTFRTPLPAAKVVLESGLEKFGFADTWNVGGGTLDGQTWLVAGVWLGSGRSEVQRSLLVWSASLPAFRLAPLVGAPGALGPYRMAGMTEQDFLRRFKTLVPWLESHPGWSVHSHADGWVAVCRPPIEPTELRHSLSEVNELRTLLATKSQTGSSV